MKEKIKILLINIFLLGMLTGIIPALLVGITFKILGLN